MLIILKSIYPKVFIYTKDWVLFWNNCWNFSFNKEIFLDDKMNSMIIGMQKRRIESYKEIK
ncbi:hypothetical protein DRJ22_00265 [Candidatus Woesearchaeota archaeon]|nr:MAG: hypothetical protein DRJ22_00265 [Candidatus Woesearchaeota archaeon]